VERYDHVVVRSGINTIVVAVMLGAEGRSALFPERNDRSDGGAGYNLAKRFAI